MILKGRIVYGKQLGRTIGFPTANLQPFSMPGQLPQNGVYAGWVYLENGKSRWPCVLNQGKHPTAPEGAPTIEVHLLDFSGDLYGQELEVEYLRFLRPEKKFDSLEALKMQIARDSERARAYCRELAQQEDRADK